MSLRRLASLLLISHACCVEPLQVRSMPATSGALLRIRRPVPDGIARLVIFHVSGGGLARVTKGAEPLFESTDETERVAACFGATAGDAACEVRFDALKGIVAGLDAGGHERWRGALAALSAPRCDLSHPPIVPLPEPVFASSPGLTWRIAGRSIRDADEGCPYAGQLALLDGEGHVRWARPQAGRVTAVAVRDDGVSLVALRSGAQTQLTALRPDGATAWARAIAAPVLGLAPLRSRWLVLAASKEERPASLAVLGETGAEERWIPLPSTAQRALVLARGEHTFAVIIEERLRVWSFGAKGDHAQVADDDLRELRR